MKATKAYGDVEDEYHYGISEGNVLEFYHLLSLVFYCDYSSLSSHFSSSFRKIKRFENLKSIKNRNQKYYYLSKYLRECVECYGRCSLSGLSFNSGIKFKWNKSLKWSISQWNEYFIEDDIIFNSIYVYQHQLLSMLKLLLNLRDKHNKVLLLNLIILKQYNVDY